MPIQATKYLLVSYSCHIMEQKDEKRRVPKIQDGSKVPPRGDGLPSTSQPSPGHTVVALDRPWANRQHTMSNNLQGPWQRATSYGGNAFERWTVQPMTDDPYQNMKSIITKKHTIQPKSTNSELPKHVSAPSQTAATSGSGWMKLEVRKEKGRTQTNEEN
ncbi:hypothetical protein F5Y06DRAFT_64367 [Hypoxylon sp. FL0890]|nr:hypothetical protein F5Y06DRAFT_64367 [Hypoxylon sp. FL0890]